MTDAAEIPLVPDRRVRAGTSPAYVSPYGKLTGLLDRLAKFRATLCVPAGPFVGLGPIADLELAMRLLSAREFAEWLRRHGDSDEAQWAVDILDALDREDEHEQMLDDIERVVPVAEGQEYAEAVEIAARKAVQADAVRAVLVNVGALAPGDTDTDLPSLVRVLLS